MPRSIAGHGRVSASRPPPAPARSSPLSVWISAVMPGNGRVADPGFVRRDARQRRDHDRAGFRLPPGIDDRAALAADVPVIPDPRFGIDRLADRSEQPQAR